MEMFIKRLFQIQNRVIQNLPDTKRFFYYDIKRSLEMDKPPSAIMIHGLRGVGKTISLLQNMKKDSVYLKVDGIGFRIHSLYDTVEYMYNNYGYNTFMIDEIHTYENWENEIKNLYDDFNDIKLVLSGSSSLIAKTKGADLSRRLKMIHARPMYLYEYVMFKTGKKPKRYSLEEMVNNPMKINLEIEQMFPNIYYLLQEYMRFGGLPIYFRNTDVVPLITNAIKKVVYVDIPNILDNVTLKTLKKLENVILYLALSSPGEFSYETVSSSVGMSKGVAYELMSVLHESDLINFLSVANKKSTVKVRKKVKVYYTHPTLRHSILLSSGEVENIGAYREEYFYHHVNMYNVGYVKRRTKEPDFEVNIGRKKYLFEIGKHKTGKSKEFINVYDSDKTKYPLYMFGFLK